MQKILCANNISKSYGDKAVLKDINLSLNEGELVCMLGVSGVGKTTLFNILSGLMKPDSGEVLIKKSHSNNDKQKDDIVKENDAAKKNEDTVSLKNSYLDITGVSGHISYMLQKDLLLPHKTVLDNAALPLVISGMSKKEARDKAALYFERFGLSGTEKKYPVQLSGGMRQRVALLRTYLCGNSVALLDEPFSALDTLTRASVHEWYLKVMEEIKLSTIFITHDIDEAILISDRICILKGQPAGITDEIVIDEPKPRGQDYVLSDKFLEYKRRIKLML
ncbi:MAG: ABC transporter ATP-binding protein [Lachnospiraceae bacterium]|nr:ABC transporter ATP-binding protein [Lachnospiraceae bacterium]